MAYFFKGLPFLIVGTIVVLSAPWLALIALIVVPLVLLPSLAFAILVVPYLLVRSVNRRSRHGLSESRDAHSNSETGTRDVHAPSSNALVVVPRGRDDGLRASIRGHSLDLADSSSGHALAPTPDDLYIASLASGLAWSARSLLREHRLPERVSVSATWRTAEDLSVPAAIDLTVTVSRRAEAVSPALITAFQNRLAARFPADPVVHISYQEESDVPNEPAVKPDDETLRANWTPFEC